MEHVVTCYDQVCTPEVSLKVMRDLALEHAAKAGRFASTLLRALNASDYKSLCHMDIPYSDDDDSDSLFHARSVLAFFQKNENIDLGVDKESVALAGFEQSEVECRNTNRRITYHRLLGFSQVSADLSSILHGAQRKIVGVLGRVPLWDDLDFSFGPGATTTVKAEACSPRFKLGANLACSSELLSYSGSLLAHCPALAQLHASTEDDDHYQVGIEIHRGKLQFVPKNAKTYRSIVVEPVLNGLGQKGIGTFIKKRLLRVAGVNLWDQSRNQGLAREGSVAGDLATVDFKAASDTISKEVVALLLPEPWFNFLSNFRTGSVEYKRGKRSTFYTLEKFSSMGNAFTFELESLIFWALASATKDHLLVDGEVSVFGDDVILPAAAYPLYQEVCSFLGFTVNDQKSFSQGPFRESCGSDWFKGFSIRPFYLKSHLSARILFVLHNYYMRNFEFAFAHKVKQLIHPEMIIFGPDGYGDGHLIGNWSPKRTPSHLSRGWDGGTFETYVDISRNSKNIRRTRGDYILPSYSVYVRSGSESPTDIFTLRGTEGYKRIRIYTHQQGVFC